MDDLERITLDRNRLRRELAWEQWRRQVLINRKWTRLGVLVRNIIRNPRRILRFPFAAIRIVFGSSQRPPRPDLAPDGRPARAPDEIGAASRQPEQASALIDEAKRLIEDGHHLAAWDRIVEADELQPGQPWILRFRRLQASRIGDPVSARGALEDLVTVSNSANNRLQLRLVEGQIRELDPMFWPRPGGSAPPLEPVSSTRVLHLLKGSFPHRVAGATTRSRYTLLAQRAAGLDPVAMTDLHFPRNEGVEEFEPLEIVDGIRHHRLDAGSDFDLRAIPNDREIELWTTLADRVVRAERPALLHAASGTRGYENALVALGLGRYHRLPVVYEVRSFHEATWTADMDLAERQPLYRMRIERENSCMLAADAVITLANSMRDDLIERGVSAERITVVPNAVDADAFVPAGRDEALYRSLGFTGETIVGYVSNLSRREGVDFLLRAVALLRADGVDVGCVVCGDGPELDGLRELAGELGIWQNVRLLGRIPHEEIQSYYELIDVFVVPRRNDRAARFVTPIKPFEAMALARPIVMADLPALREIIDPPSRGCVFAPEQPSALAEALRPLIENPDSRAQLGQMAREWVVRERSWAANAARYVDLYASLLENAGAIR